MWSLLLSYLIANIQVRYKKNIRIIERRNVFSDVKKGSSIARYTCNTALKPQRTLFSNVFQYIVVFVDVII